MFLFVYSDTVSVAHELLPPSDLSAFVFFLFFIPLLSFFFFWGGFFCVRPKNGHLMNNAIRCHNAKPRCHRRRRVGRYPARKGEGWAMVGEVERGGATLCWG